MNPVLRREVIERFRTRRSPWFIFGWTIGIGLIGYVAYLTGQQFSNAIFGRLIATQYMGRFLFQAMAILMMSAVVLIVPGVTALSIVSERERQTLPLLQVTQLSPLQLIWGKLASSMSFFLLLLAAVAPVVAVPLLFGGMSLGDVAASLGMMLATAVMLGSASIVISARARTSRGAVAGSYAFAFVIAFLTFALILSEVFVLSPSGQTRIPPRGREYYSSWLNPFVGMVDAVNSPLRLQPQYGFTPFGPIDSLIYARQGVSTGGGFMPMPMDVFARGGGFGFGGAEFAAPIDNGGAALIRMRRGPVWIRTLILYAVITALSLMRAAYIVRTPQRKLRTITRRSKDAPA